MSPNKSLLPTAYVADAPPASAEFKRYALKKIDKSIGMI